MSIKRVWIRKHGVKIPVYHNKVTGVFWTHKDLAIEDYWKRVKHVRGLARSCGMVSKEEQKKWSEEK